MKTTMYLFLSVMLFTACQNDCPERYTQNAPEIDTYKQGLVAYESQDWDAMKANFADDAKISYNALKGNSQSVSEVIEGHKSMVSQFSSYGFVPNESEYERVITDDGEMWVNFWGTWSGVLAATETRVEMPVHLTSKFIDGKIVEEHGYWNELILYMAFQEAEAMNAMEEKELTEE